MDLDYQRSAACESALHDITKALRNLMRNESTEDANSTASSEEENPDYFCVEDIFLSSDLKVEVEGIGTLQFPLSEESVNKLIEISSKAKFGRGEETVLDVNVRDSLVIPALKLNVKIDEEAFNNALERIGVGLNTNKSGKLVPHLYNMLIYSPGQFFKLHSDSPKEKNMVATLVIVLPSTHKGGDLIIHHNNKRHIFFGSQNPSFVKCVAFYSDCQHEIRKVTEGFRVALTYNVILLPSCQIASGINVDDTLNNAMNSYFFGNNPPYKLVFLLNHSYSENNLMWDLLKGADRMAALNLYVVAKNQNRDPCLALAKYKETCDVDDTSEVLEEETVLYFWKDDQNLKMCEKTINVHDNEVCYTMETTELFQPYKTEYSGPTGNAGETRDNWYQRACVVVWSNKWVFSTGYNLALNELHQLTTCAGNESIVTEEIDKASPYFYNEQFWESNDVFNKLIEIAVYTNDPSRAIPILSAFPRKLLDPENISRLLILEKKFEKATWNKVMTSWTNVYTMTVRDALVFIDKYTAHPGKLDGSVILDYVLGKAIDKFISTDHRSIKYSNPYLAWYGSSQNKTSKTYMFDKISDDVMDNFLVFLEICSNLGKTNLQEKLVQYVVASPHIFTPLSVAELYLKIEEKFNQDQFPSMKTMKELAVDQVNKQIPELANCSNNWYFDIKIPCGCRFCSEIQIFFLSKTQKKVVVPASKDNRRHIYSHLNPLSSYPIKFHTERVGSPYKIIIEKNSNVLEERRQILSELLEMKRKLNAVNTERGESMTSTTPTDGLQPNIELSDSGSDETPTKRSRMNIE